MRIDKANLIGLAIAPPEDDPPLVVDPDRMKVLQIPLSRSRRSDGGTARSLNRFAALIASNLRFALRAIP
jgi:hypothetical protein